MTKAQMVKQLLAEPDRTHEDCPVDAPSLHEHINEIVVFASPRRYMRYAIRKILSWMGIGPRPVKANLVIPSRDSHRVHSLGFAEIAFKPHTVLGKLSFGLRLRNLDTGMYAVKLTLRNQHGQVEHTILHQVVCAKRGEILDVPAARVDDAREGLFLHLTINESDAGRIVYEMDPIVIKRLSQEPALASEKVSWNRRALDIVVGLVLLGVNIILAPILVALTFCFVSRKIFYRVDRPGAGGQRVAVWKYRTMPTTKIARISDFDPSFFPFVGICLRAMALDELPQCMNLLKGEWQIFGPRSVNVGVEIEGTPLDAIQYNREIYGQMRPGLFNLTSALMGKGKDAINLPTRYRYEKYHRLHRNLRLDMKILLRSIMEIILLENVEDYLPADSPLKTGSVLGFVRNAVATFVSAICVESVREPHQGKLNVG